MNMFGTGATCACVLLVLALAAPAAALRGLPRRTGVVMSASLEESLMDRRGMVGRLVAAAAVVATPGAGLADDGGVPGASYQVQASSMPLGLGNMAGKTRPDNGVTFWGDSVAEQGNTGAVTAEIVDSSGAVITTTFASPKLKLASGSAFDVEVRDRQNGEGAYLMMVAAPKGVRSVADVKDTFFTDEILKGTGRFGAYGAPTDIKVKSSSVKDNGFREVEFVFKALSPTYAEVPRRAVVAATIPDGSTDVVMLVGGSTAARWSKGAEPTVRDILSSFKVSRREPRNKKGGV